MGLSGAVHDVGENRTGKYFYVVSLKVGKVVVHHAVIKLQLLLLTSETLLQEMGSYVCQERVCKYIWSAQ